jgi:hypothetical protein
MNEIHLYWLLTSHISGLFPVVITYLDFKEHRKYQSLYMFFNNMAAILFSILYHTIDYGTVNEPIKSTNDVWILLDHWSASRLVVSTSFYLLCLKTEIFYVYIYFMGIILLIIKLLSPHLLSFVTIFSCFFMSMIRYKIILKYFCNFPKTSISFVLLILISTFFWFLGLKGNYELWHSLWHLGVFTASGIGCKARNLLYRKYYSNNLTDQNTELRVYSRTTSTSI